MELIDTCWNVNAEINRDTAIISRINRYMLECKQGREAEHKCKHEELIDTCWNVNREQKTEWVKASIELIDTCWNVNLSKAY